MDSVKFHVDGNQTVSFKHFRQGVLYYETEKGLTFEVPASETGTGTFGKVEKAIMFMKWIKRQIQKNEEALNENNDAMHV